MNLRSFFIWTPCIYNGLGYDELIRKYEISDKKLYRTCIFGDSLPEFASNTV